MKVRNAFSHFARHVATAIGTPYAFAIAFGVIVLWAVLGPVFDYSDRWQLLINTSTTIITFLVVFLIQTTQNRDSKAIHLKLDELVRSISKARDRLIDAEDLAEEELDSLEHEFRRLRESVDLRTRAHTRTVEK